MGVSQLLEKTRVKMSGQVDTNYSSRPIFDPNIQLKEYWMEDLKINQIYTICLVRFVQTINDRSNHDSRGYVKFIASTKEDLKLNDIVVDKSKVSLFVLQLPLSTLINKWTSHCDNPAINFKDMDNLLLRFKKTSQKRLVKLDIKNIGAETEW